MPLPRIDPYELPTAPDLPPNRAPWSPDPRRAALLVHDMQRYFLRPYPRGGAPLDGVLDNTARLVRLCRAQGVPVVYTAKPGGMDPRRRGLERDFWGPGMGDAREQTAIAEELRPEEGDILLTKSRYSAFAGTGLAERLGEAGRDQILVTGVYAHIGCLLSAADAFMRDIQPFLVADAVADFSADDHMYAVRYVAGRCGVVVTTGSAVQHLRPVPSST